MDNGGRGKRRKNNEDDSPTLLKQLSSLRDSHNQQVVDFEDSGSSSAANLGTEGLKLKTKNMVNVFNYLNYRKVEEQTIEMKDKILGDGGRGIRSQISSD